jgi:hypothetical protein
MKKIYKENCEALALRDEIHRLSIRRDELNIQLCEKRDKMQHICIHNETEIKDSYVGGGYLNREQFIKTTICKICGKQIKEDITYGGFN